MNLLLRKLHQQDELAIGSGLGITICYFLPREVWDNDCRSNIPWSRNELRIQNNLCQMTYHGMMWCYPCLNHKSKYKHFVKKKKKDLIYYTLYLYHFVLRWGYSLERLKSHKLLSHSKYWSYTESQELVNHLSEST